ncbi:tetratricopeptide repeat protein [Mongoliitalea daihaiensis]|uniref:tetratricopeptide repeat protein n=1 Tax=Mongoliitalea daihaiensis TaxID=2782006 RepID=UPI001F37C545|nr:tetratricopeptide repeat protein [Mongoliitalea daihaiensis]UJP65783.1 tetratricopeptide repeat protein [Mongoliitalea daihaiensis]
MRKWKIYCLTIAWLGVVGTALAQYSVLDKQMEEALKLSDEGELVDAFEILTGIIQERPYFAEVYFYRAIVFEKAGDLQGALTDLNILLELDPMHSEGLFSRGMVRYQLKQYALAKEDFKALLYTPIRETTTILYQRPSFSSGITGIVSQQGGKRDLIYMQLGLVALQMQEYQESIQSFSEAIKLNPRQPDYLINLGKVYQVKGELALAEGYFLRALELDPYHTVAHQYLAELSQKTGDWEKAVELYSQSIEDEPDFYLPYKQRGFQWIQQEKWSEAFRDLDKANELQPNDVEVLFNLAYVLEKLDRWEAAVKSYEEVLAIEPTHVRANYGKGNALYKNSQWEQAIAFYSVALVWDPAFGPAYYQRGITRYRLGKKIDACQDLHKAVGLGVIQAKEAQERICP